MCIRDSNFSISQYLWHMKYLLLALCLPAFFACSQPPKEAVNAPKNENYASFKYSTETYTIDARDPTNWCNIPFRAAALISADPKNYNRRLFAVSDIPTRVVVFYGQLSAVFILNQVGNQVDLYTSDNLPGCLSNKVNFQLSPDGLSFRYDNKAGIDIDVYLQEFPSGLQIALDLPPGGNHGMTVHRCETCK